MGSDNLFHKRKAQSQRNLKRETLERAPYEKVLIVCEGRKTEPYYFTELRDYYRLNTTNVMVSGNCGSDPLSVINYGKKLYKEEKEKGDAYDRVYCVMDRDAHANYRQALNDIANAKPKNTFFAITSVPCFEYWLLLHFIYTTAPYSAVGGTSSGVAVLSALRTQWPEYEKAFKGTFLYLVNDLEKAKVHAARAFKAVQNNSTDNPSTRVHELVDYLQHLKD